MKHKGATEGEQAVASTALTRLKKIHKLRSTLEGVIEFDQIVVRERPPSKSEVAKNIATGGAALGALGGGAYVAKRYVIPAAEAVQKEAAPATRQIKSAILDAIQAGRETAEHFRGTSENARFATAHLASLGRFYKLAGMSHDPLNPGGAEYLLHPGWLKRDVSKAYHEGLTGPPGWGTALGRKARHLIKHYESLDEYIAFKEAEEEDNELVKRLKKTKLRRRSHGGGT